MRKKDNNVRNIILISGILLVIYLFLDITNFFCVWDFKVSNINDGLFSALLNVGVVVVLYIISYLVIDKRAIKKEKNAKDVVDVLIEETYKKCKEMLKCTEDRAFVGKYIFPKTSSDKPIFEDNFLNHLKSYPFYSYETIMQFCVNGIIDKHYIEEYLYVKSTYERLLTNRITMFDLITPKDELQASFLKEMEDDTKSLNEIFDKKGIV